MVVAREWCAARFVGRPPWTAGQGVGGVFRWPPRSIRLSDSVLRCVVGDWDPCDACHARW